MGDNQYCVSADKSCLLYPFWLLLNLPELPVF